MIESTYSWLSLVGLVSSNRRWQRPPNSRAMPKSIEIAWAREWGGRGQEPDHGGLVRRKLALFGLIVPHEPLHGRQGGLIGGELGAGRRTVLLHLLARFRGRGEVLHQQVSGDRHHRHHD